MKTVNFTPRAVSGISKDADGAQKQEKPTYSGVITLRVPTFFERQELKGLMINVIAQGGEADLETLRDAGSRKVNLANAMASMAKMVQASVPFYVSVDLKKLADGSELKSFDDLSMDPDAEGILQEVAQELASGLSLSKN